LISIFQVVRETNFDSDQHIRCFAQKMTTPDQLLFEWVPGRCFLHNH
jgi:hypothetical protein